MKYLILVICGLFYLSSFSDHKKDPMSEEDKARYHELGHKDSKTDKEWEEFSNLEEEFFIEYDKFYNHFNKYMSFEMMMDQVTKEDPIYFPQLYSQTRPAPILYEIKGSYEQIDAIDIISDCTKDRLKKGDCPKTPYEAIYWVKKYFESGHCVSTASEKLHDLMHYYVIPKTDMENNKDYFNLLNYISAYFYNITSIADELVSMEEWAKMMRENNYSEQKIKKHYERSKKYLEKRSKQLRKKTKQLRQNLSEKQKVMADKIINDLIQKWSKKYGKANIYECRAFFVFQYEDRRKFLEKNYPHFD